MIENVPIRLKLALLAGVPILGALLLSWLVVTDAQDRARKAEALGSIENLARLSAGIGGVVQELQLERAWTALHHGRRHRAVDDLLAETGAGPTTAEEPLRPELLADQRKTADERIEALEAFLRGRDLSQFPDRLSSNLGAAEAQLKKLSEFREQATQQKAKLQDILDFYGKTTSSLVRATAALADLSDDGEMLRVITSLVAVLEVKERASVEHAILANSLAAGAFSPGSYRRLVTVLSEKETYAEVLGTLATSAHRTLFESRKTGAEAKRADAIRKASMEATDDELVGSADAWFSAQNEIVEQLGKVEKKLNAEVKSVALSKLQESKRAVTLSLSLAGAVLFIGVSLAWAIATSVTRSVHRLEDASVLVAAGDFSVRVNSQAGDELGRLGRTFDNMVTEIERAREAFSDRVRMANELEIAANLQRAILPPNPTHPGFEFAGRMTPADEVGGDFYDVLHDEEANALWVTIGDVSNHGLGAGLVMLMTQSAYASQFCATPEASPDTVFKGVNRVLRENVAERLKDNKYVTSQLLVYRGDGQFDCAGGHEWPVLYRKESGEAESIEAPGPWLGIMERLDDVPVTRIDMAIGDVLCLYSDGITEARDSSGELFDVNRLEASLAKGCAELDSLGEVADAIFAAAHAHCDVPDDDWTLLLLRRTA